jgi:hypothetical protein
MGKEKNSKDEVQSFKPKPLPPHLKKLVDEISDAFVANLNKNVKKENE